MKINPDLWNENLTQAEEAKKFNCTQQAIAQAIKNWGLKCKNGKRGGCHGGNQGRHGFGKREGTDRKPGYWEMPEDSARNIEIRALVGRFRAGDDEAIPALAEKGIRAIRL